MTEMPPAGVPAPGTYTLDPERTTIHADVKAMFGLMTVHGTFRLQSGQVSIAADPGASSVRASIAAGSYASGNTSRDADVLSANLLDARAYPEITFTGQGARRDGRLDVLGHLAVQRRRPGNAGHLLICCHDN